MIDLIYSLTSSYLMVTDMLWRVYIYIYIYIYIYNPVYKQHEVLNNDICVHSTTVDFKNRSNDWYVHCTDNKNELYICIYTCRINDFTCDSWVDFRIWNSVHKYIYIYIYICLYIYMRYKKLFFRSVPPIWVIYTVDIIIYMSICIIYIHLYTHIYIYKVILYTSIYV